MTLSDGLYIITNLVPRFEQIYTLKLKISISFVFLIALNKGVEPTLGLYKLWPSGISVTCKKHV